MKIRARHALDMAENAFDVDVVDCGADGRKVINPADGMLIPIQRRSDGMEWFMYPRGEYMLQTFVMQGV